MTSAGTKPPTPVDVEALRANMARGGTHTPISNEALTWLLDEMERLRAELGRDVTGVDAFLDDVDAEEDELLARAEKAERERDEARVDLIATKALLRDAEMDAQIKAGERDEARAALERMAGWGESRSSGHTVAAEIAREALAAIDEVKR